jgi:hypothetical protein
MTSSRVAAPAVAIAILVTGCGGSSNKQLGYSGLIAKANALCAASQTEFAKAGSAKDAAKILDKYVAKFKQLKPPDQLKSPFDAFVSVSEEQVAALKRGDATTANKLDPRSNELASQIGAQQCISKP